MIKNSNNINEFVNLVNLKVRLSDFISQFINLSERGNSYVGKCPFHNENTPSFNVNNEKGLFYCFGCKAGGNIITFTRKYKNLTFNEAVNYISEYTGVKFLNIPLPIIDAIQVSFGLLTETCPQTAWR